MLLKDVSKAVRETWEGCFVCSHFFGMGNVSTLNFLGRKDFPIMSISIYLSIYYDERCYTETSISCRVWRSHHSLHYKYRITRHLNAHIDTVCRNVYTFYLGLLISFCVERRAVLQMMMMMMHAHHITCTSHGRPMLAVTA